MAAQQCVGVSACRHTQAIRHGKPSGQAVFALEISIKRKRTSSYAMMCVRYRRSAQPARQAWPCRPGRRGVRGCRTSCVFLPGPSSLSSRANVMSNCSAAKPLFLFFSQKAAFQNFGRKNGWRTLRERFLSGGLSTGASTHRHDGTSHRSSTAGALECAHAPLVPESAQPTQGSRKPCSRVDGWIGRTKTTFYITS